MIYESTNIPLARALRGIQGKRILDVGCGACGRGQALEAEGNVVEGITHQPAEAELGAGRISKVHLLDLNHFMPFESGVEGPFDVLMFADVLEHLVDPLGVLDSLLPLLAPGGQVYVSLPNVACFYVRFGLLFGRFRMSDSGGILDETHLHFYTRKTARELLEAAGLEIDRTDYVPGASAWLYQWAKRPTSAPPGEAGQGRLFRTYEHWAYPVERFVTGCLPGLFTNQYVFVCRKNGASGG